MENQREMYRSLTAAVGALLTAAIVTTPLAARADDLCGLGVPGNDVAAAAGADWVRASLYWGALETDAANNYQESAYLALDNTLKARTASGAPRIQNALVGIEGFANYVGAGGQYQSPCDPANWSLMLDRWRALWSRTTARYCANNPASNPGQTHGVVRYWTVWNEPNDLTFLVPRATCGSAPATFCAANPAACTDSFAADYADLVAYAEAGRQEGCPNDTKLVAGEVAQSASGNEDAFVQSLLQKLAGRATPSVLSAHTYTWAVNARQKMQRFRADLDAAGYHPTELWMTEAGGPQFGSGCTTADKAYDPTCFAQREGFLRSIFAENRQYGTALGWKRTFIYSSTPLELPLADGGVERYGLIDVDGAGAPIGSNMMLDAVKASCNNPLAYMVDSEEKPDNDDLQSACNAIATRNSSYCNGLAEGNGKQMCLAMSQGSASPCWSITDNNLQLACLGMSAKASANCSGITNGNMKSFCYGVALSDYTQCSSITERNTQLLCYAMSDGINSNCYDIPYANDRNFCYGASSGDASYCAAIVQYPSSVQR
jgi:hypothetical protein